MKSSIGASDGLIHRGHDIEDVSTYDEISAKGKAVRDLLTDLGIRLHRESELAKLLHEADRIAVDFAEERPLHAIEGLLRTAHVNRLTSAILAVGRQPAARDCLSRMTSGTLDPAVRSTSSGKDALWEIELAAKLQLQGLPVSLAEPDIVLDLDGERYPIACKKVYSEKGVGAQMRKGVKQLEHFGAPGIVAFNIDELTPAHSIFVSPNTRVAGDHLAQLNRDFVDRHQRVLERFIADGRCHGVLVAVSVVADLEATRPRLNTFTQTTVWTLSYPHGPTVPAFTTIINALQRLTTASHLA